MVLVHISFSEKNPKKALRLVVSKKINFIIHLRETNFYFMRIVSSEHYAGF